jgi:hypothetical protein
MPLPGAVAPTGNMYGQGGDPKKRRRKVPYKFLTFLVLLAVVVYAVQRQGVREVSLKNKTITFWGLDGRSADAPTAEQQAQIEQKQSTFADRLSKLEEQASAGANANPNPNEQVSNDAPETADVSGMWIAANGFQYQLSQTGDAVTVVETFIQSGSITSVGNGKLAGRSLSFQLTDLVNVATANVTVSEDGLRLDGTVSGNGTTMEIHWTRS